MEKTHETKKGVTSDTFSKAPASSEKPKSCVKAVMLTALQRLPPRFAEGELWSAVGITALRCGRTCGEDS